MKNIYYILLITMFFSCKTIPKGYHAINGTIPVSSSEKCVKVYNDIKKKWAANDSFPDCYFYNKELMKKIGANVQCFFGKDTSQIKSLFGVSSRQYFQNRIDIYSLSKICRDTIGDIYFSEHKLNFYYSSDGKVESVQIQE